MEPIFRARQAHFRKWLCPASDLHLKCGNIQHIEVRLLLTNAALQPWRLKNYMKIANTQEGFWSVVENWTYTAINTRVMGLIPLSISVGTLEP